MTRTRLQNNTSCKW